MPVLIVAGSPVGRCTIGSCVSQADLASLHTSGPLLYKRVPASATFELCLNKYLPLTPVSARLTCKLQCDKEWQQTQWRRAHSSLPSESEVIAISTEKYDWASQVREKKR